MKTTLPCLLALCLPLSAALPYEAAELKAKRDAKISEINTAYYGALSKLADRYAAAGDAAKAAEVKKELEKPMAKEEAVAADDGADAKLKPLVGVWKRDTDNGIWKITDTKGGVFNDNLTFTMSFDEGNNRIAVVGSHWADYLTFSANPDVVNGSTKINGKTMRYRLTRIR